MERSLRVYNTLNPQPEFPSDEDWKSCVDFEAVLNITRGLTTVSQYEKKFISAMIIVVKIQTYQKHLANSIMVADFDNWKEKKVQ